MVLDGSINGVAFQACVEQFLVPEPKPGDIVILDNLGSHKAAQSERRARGSQRSGLLEKNCRTTEAHFERIGLF
jgi:hypothetical protein